jgi:hypothetical protein
MTANAIFSFAALIAIRRRESRRVSLARKGDEMAVVLGKFEPGR